MVAKPFNSCIALCNYIITICISITSILITQVLLISGDTETNPGLKNSSATKFCHWNLNGLAAHDFVKVPLIEVFITTHNFDIVCLSEIFLDSTIPHNDENININGYSLLRVDHPNNIKREGVCMYFKEFLPLIRRTDLSNMKECLVTEINVIDEKCSFTCLHRSPSQSHEELESFCSSLDSLLSNINNQHPACSIAIGDFHAKCSKECTSDKDNTTGLELDSITTTAGYCIDLTFSSNTSFVNKWKVSCQSKKNLIIISCGEP